MPKHGGSSQSARRRKRSPGKLPAVAKRDSLQALESGVRSRELIGARFYCWLACRTLRNLLMSPQGSPLSPSPIPHHPTRTPQPRVPVASEGPTFPGGVWRARAPVAECQPAERRH